MDFKNPNVKLNVERESCEFYFNKTYCPEVGKSESEHSRLWKLETTIVSKLHLFVRLKCDPNLVRLFFFSHFKHVALE